MRHYISYSSADKEGEIHWPEPPYQFGIKTNSSVVNAVGSRIWFISAIGSPKLYRLCSTFIGDDRSRVPIPIKSTDNSEIVANVSTYRAIRRFESRSMPLEFGGDSIFQPGPWRLYDNSDTFWQRSRSGEAGIVS